ncbi:unnamed protein product [Blepharisma stoltei]|uniref:Uncharacterized protein n=1 Tax=Blepharisma stoltei TaxID=1481888 RepID=A0AAU9IKT1_9CILI|nr:unnamed protein product [Blepharisma stoltei]
MKRFLLYLGAGTLAAFSYDPIYYAYKWNYKEPIDLKKNYGSGSYALITGASDGIGKAFSRAIAAQGLNVILVGRNSEKLRTVQAEIEHEFNVKVVTMTVNLEEIHENLENIEKSKASFSNMTSLFW